MQTRILLGFFKKAEALKIKAILNMMTDFNVDISDNYDEALSLYKEKKHEFIIMDHQTKNGNFFFEDILAFDAKQNIVLVSDTLMCPISCDECLLHYKFLRLVKPIDYKRLIPYLNGKNVFECLNQYKFEKISSIEALNELLYVGDNLVYNKKELKENKLILSSKNERYDANFTLKEFSLIENIISNGFFKMELLHDQTIEIGTTKE